MAKTIIIVVVVIICVIGGYLGACYGLWMKGIKDMTKQVAAANDTESGLELVKNAEKSPKEYVFDIYSEQEIREEPTRANVKLYCFPVAEQSDYVIVLPGGAYQNCSANEEGFPTACRINQLGYTAFVLQYRVNQQEVAYAPLYDLQRAVKFITENSEKLNVNKENYAVCGFSAGGNLAGIFGDDTLEFRKDIISPSALLMGYPAIDPNCTKSLNPVEAVYYAIMASGVADNFVKGDKSKKDFMLVNNHVNANYPKVYVMHGTADCVLPVKYQSDLFVKKLKEYGIECRYYRPEGVHHGVGVGKGTNAEGWLDRAIAFWQE